MNNSKPELEAKYGLPITNRKGAIALNTIFFSASFLEENEIIYEPIKKSFLLYNPEEGVWAPVSDAHIHNKVEEFLLTFARTHRLKQEIITKLSATFISGVIKSLAGKCENSLTRKTNGYPIHCANTMLEWNGFKWVSCPFSPSYFSRNRNPIPYDVEAGCPRFLKKLLAPAMTESDIALLQLYFGQCLLGVNLSHTFLLLTGTAGGGKSTLVNVIEGVIGRNNCTELRTEFLNGRFEISRTYNKTLLTAKDVPGNFLSTAGAQRLKALTGKDTVTLEYKNSNESIDLVGTFNAIITSNTILRLHFDGDEEAWRRRLLWIRYDRPPVTEKIVDFDQQLLEEEGSGILNWALDGAAALLRKHGELLRDEEQKKRIDYLLASSIPLEACVREHVIPDTEYMVTTETLVYAFKQYSDKMKWPQLPTRIIERELPEAMRRIYAANKRTDISVNGKFRRGYKYFRLRPIASQDSQGTV